MKRIIQSKKYVLLIIAVITLIASGLLWREHQYVRLIDSIGSGDNETAVELIEKYNFDLDKMSGHFPWKYLPGFDELNSPLEIACECGNNEAAFILIENGADASIIHKGHFSLLYLSMASTELDDYELIKTLIKNGADVNDMGIDQNVLVRCAYMSCSDYDWNFYSEKWNNERYNQKKDYMASYDPKKAKEIVQIYKMLEKQADNNLQSSMYGLPLGAAVSRQNSELITYLLDNKRADINEVDYYGETCAFGLAHHEPGVQYNKKWKKDTFNLLLQKGIDINLKNNDGLSLRDVAIKNEDKYLFGLIEANEK